jgi:tetratricopeptide (TPR) repeat protein
VAWITERKNVLSLVFYLLAIRVYLFQFNANRSARPYAMALIFFLCALFSKTVTASLPAAILLILWWKNARIRLRDLWPLIPFFVVGIVMGAVTGYLEAHHVGATGDIVPELRLSFVQRCLIAGRVIWFYLAKLVYPHPLTFIYPRWNEIDHPTAIQWIFPALVIITTLALFALRHRIGRGVLVLWLLFCGTLFPALGFANVYPMRFSFVADHFQYHASIAIFTLIAALTTHIAPRMREVFYGIILITLASLTWNQTHIYQDAETLWRDTRNKNPNSWMVWTNLGNALAQQKRYDEAIPYYMKALELAPNLHDTHWNVGVALVRQGKVDEAETEFRKAIEIMPTFAHAYESLGELYYYRRNDPQKAIQYYQQALKIAPDFAEANYYYAVALEHEANEAREQYIKTKNQTDGMEALNKLNEAIDHYRTAVAANTDYLEAHYDLASCLMKLGQFDEAIWNLREAVRIDPEYAEAWLNLGSALYQSGHFPDAAGAFEQALRIRPGWDIAQKNLQAARSRM